MSKWPAIAASIVIIGTLVAFALPKDAKYFVEPFESNLVEVGAINEYPQPIEINGQTITFTWTDDNTDEDILLFTDKQNYTDSVSSAEVYLAVVNNGPNQQVTLNGLFGKTNEKVNRAFILTEKTKKEDILEEVCESIVYEDVINTINPLPPERKDVCYKQKTGTQDVIYKDWEEISLVDRDKVDEDLNLKDKKRKDSDGYSSDKSIKFAIKQNETVYLKLDVDFSANENGNFFLEAIGDSGSMGHLDPWFDSSWDYRVRLEVDSSKVPSTLTSFPVNVDLSDLPNDFHTNVKTDGCDIRVIESDEETETPIDLVSYNSGTDSGELHFLADSLSGSATTTFYIYYGNSGASCYADNATYGANNVWPSYDAVHHFEDLNDSTASANNLTNSGATQVVGKIGQGYDLGTSNYLTFGTSFTFGATHSVEFWAEHDGVNNTGVIIADTSNHNTYHFLTTNLGYYEINDNGTRRKETTVDWTWTNYNRFVVVQDASSIILYVNGVAKTLDSSATLGAFANSIDRIGGYGVSAYSWDGEIDEFRYTNSVKLSADWIATDYNNQSSPSTFYFIASQETAPPVASPPTRTPDFLWIVYLLPPQNRLEYLI